MEDIDFDRDVQIDPNSLDTEWLFQTELAGRYCKQVAHMKYKCRDLGEKKKIIRSELILEANANPETCCGKAKPNAADIEAYYRRHESYKKVVEELSKMMEEVEYTELAKNEISWTRKIALENLVTLHGQQWFAGPKMPRNLSEEWKKKQKQADAGIAKAMRRK